MNRFPHLLRRFGRDERGVFAVIFGLMAIVLVAVGGAVVDYVSLEQTRNRAQIALDAAALALQPEIFTGTSTATIQSRAQALLTNRVGDSRVTATIVRTVPSSTNGSLFFEATINMPTFFVRLVGVPQLGARIRSEATRKKLAIEVAFVLDNSGSMSYTGAGTNGTRQRMQFLKDAAKCATNILFYKTVVDSADTCLPATGATLVEDVSIAVVPFNMFVNVGAANSTAAWMDRTGASVTHYDNFDNDDDEDRLVTSLTSPSYLFPNRFTLFTASGEAWRGCVEARPHIKTGTTASEYLDTDDSVPLAANTLYVPMFSPDLVDGYDRNNYISDTPAICDRPAQGTTTRCDYTEQRTRYSSSYSWGTPTVISSTVSGPENFTNNTLYQGAYYGRRPPGCTCRTSTSVSGWSGSTTSQTRTGYCSTYTPAGLSDRELEERVCKYYAGVGTTAFGSGPNADCVRTAILPLSTNPTTVQNTINGMAAEGGTNIHEGTVWGFRALSPTQPFVASGYDEATSKVMIIMTDGENTAYNLNTHCGSTERSTNGSCYNSAYGFPYNSRNTNATSTSGGNIERLGFQGATNAQLVTAMNERTVQSCTNAKAAGITVYTIGLATSEAEQSTQAVVEQMLRDCASSTQHAYFPQTPAGLKATFTEIANELSALRLAQ